MKDKLSLLFIQHLLKTLPKKSYKYGDDEFFITDGQKLYSYDFTDIENKKILEFNGNFFHANPNQYDMNELLNFKCKQHYAKDIWIKDYKKIKIAIENGYEIMVVWESEYKSNPSKIISTCKKFILGE
jgi:very-short-patch-repair endonuclease